MAQKIGKRDIYAGVLAVILAVCLALGIYFLLPNSAAVYADNSDDIETIVSHSSGDDHSTTDGGIEWTNLNTSGYSFGGTIEESGNYYLSEDITGTITIPDGITVYLCLNGKILDGNSSGSVITVNGTLYLCDCKDGDKTVNNTVNVYTDSTLATTEKTFNSGVITGGYTTTMGGGVYVSGCLYMYGGAISGNFAVHVGGVCVWGTFEMYGGTISGNESYDGGVCVMSSGTFTMNGGTISGNVAPRYGGGVYVLGTFEMNGGTITENTAHEGGGVFVDSNATFKMEGGTISNNEVTYNGSGVYVFNSTFEMNGGYLDGNVYNYNSGTITIKGGYLSRTAYDDLHSYNAISESCTAIQTGDGTYAWAVISATDNKHNCTADNTDNEYNYIDAKDATEGILTLGSENATYYYLAADMTLNITISSGTTVYFCLNGHTLTGTGSGSVITIENGAKLYLYDCSEEQTGTITGGSATYGGGVFVDSNAKFIMESGTISGNSAEWGSGVSVAVSGVFELCGGTVSDNTAFYGGVYVEGTFEMYSGTISDNDAYFGGGVYVTGTFTMNGGEISNNSTWYYGGVFVNVGAIFTMNDGNISNNNAEYGGGVFAYYGTFEMYDGAISGNNASYGGGVYVYSGTFEMYGGAISGNEATYYGGGVSVDCGIFTMNGGAISDNEATDDGDGMDIYYGTFEMNGGYLDGNVYNDNGTITITGGYLSETAHSSVVYEDTSYIDSSSTIIDDTGYGLCVYAVIPDGAEYSNTATCTAGGVGTYTYTIGEKNYSITVITTATGHSTTHHAANAATCTTDGNEEYWYCESCEKYFSDKECENETSLAAVTLSATGHSTTHYAETEATETNDGNYEYWYCEDCEKYFEDEDCATETTLEELTILTTGATDTSYTAHFIIWGFIAVEIIIGSALVATIYECPKRRKK